jgi:hypothetical protein
MQTVKQIEKLWNARRYEALLRELTACRTDADFVPLMHAGPMAIPAAAMAIIRLDEFAQAGAPIYHKLVLCLLASQEADGGWGDPIVSALCLRALLAGRGTGEAVDQAINYLANLQKEEGIWPRIPFRRMPADALTSAVVLYHLSHESRFRAAVQFDQAVQWFDEHTAELDGQTRKLWQSIRLRCGMAHVRHERRESLWTAAS